jgi:hypothetical protein
VRVWKARGGQIKGRRTGGKHATNYRSALVTITPRTDIVRGAHKIAEPSPRLVTFNGHSFDLRILRYRAMVLGVSAPGLPAPPISADTASSHGVMRDLGGSAPVRSRAGGVVFLAIND